MTKRFQRTEEPFTCQHCGQHVLGNGYTNHCPNCLWSKHVDVHPGDRAATCQGMMKPIGVDLKAGEYIILHQCLVCDHKKRNKAAQDDNFEAVLGLSGQPTA